MATTASTAIADERNPVLVSAASVWEMATKHRLGKLGRAAQAVDRYAELIHADGFEHLAVLPLKPGDRSGQATKRAPAPICFNRSALLRRRLLQQRA